MKRSKGDTIYQRYSREDLAGIYCALNNRGQRSVLLDNLEKRLYTLDNRIAMARENGEHKRVEKLTEARNSIMQTLTRAGRVR